MNILRIMIWVFFRFLYINFYTFSKAKIFSAVNTLLPQQSLLPCPRFSSHQPPLLQCLLTNTAIRGREKRERKKTHQEQSTKSNLRWRALIHHSACSPTPYENTNKQSIVVLTAWGLPNRAHLSDAVVVAPAIL